MIRVLVADDHGVVRQGLKKILSEELGTVVYGEAETGQEVLESVRTQEWDILILDITMPGKSGFDILKELKSERPGLPILVLSMHPEDQFALRILREGAAGYVTKERAPREVVAAVKKVLAGERYISPSFAQRLVLDMADGSAERLHENLSHREFQVLRMIAAGRTITEIAQSFSLSVKTVSTYRQRILTKLRVGTNAELTAYATRNQLV